MGEWNDEVGLKVIKCKIYIGKGVKFYENIGVGEFFIEVQGCKSGDEFVIIGLIIGVIEGVLDEMCVDNMLVELVSCGVIIMFFFLEKICFSDKFYKLVFNL